MRLTNQMIAEIDGIQKYVDEMNPMVPLLRKEILEKTFTLNSIKYIVENSEQLKTYKVRLENLLCETDSQERDH